MRDGVHLFTAVSAPKDSSQTYPFLTARTSYSVAPYGSSVLKAQLSRKLKAPRSGTRL
jgi:predicted acyl esterase